ncbi:predicted protein [Naegleria gruberi]|uniref:Predicted protein n=1 Tax=Naegleria gruberi TaxID=5762 RepID=D2VDR4_NAEGR|nr:uncharacterized protein NAEGRDRAFT_67012 [Naegleria gruberi]EFC44944.1 predicted protein [Naegleria gruberi]|eukprot:XP_002677688.1 predicted protein [Naegleria gruberi strain NEG-M]
MDEINNSPVIANEDVLEKLETQDTDDDHSEQQVQLSTLIRSGVNNLDRNIKITFHIDSHFLNVSDVLITPTVNSQGFVSDNHISAAQLVQPKDGYEITITDRETVIVVILSPLLNELITQSKIRENTKIMITKYKVLIDEKVKGKQKGVVFIQSLEIISQNKKPRVSIEDFSQVLDEARGNICPLLSGRGFYMPLEDEDNFDFEVYSGTVPEVTLVEPFENVSQLADIIGSGVKKPFIARIWKKSKIRYFGKTNEEKQYPMFYVLLITDKSTPKGVPVTIWNELALKTYGDLSVGDIISAEEYRVKNFHDSGVFSTKFKTEISINPTKSRVIPIQKLDDRIASFAPIEFPLTNINTIIQSKLDGTVLNIMGIVANIGPYRREKSQHQFSQYRYVTLMDPSSISAMSVKLYTNSRKHILDTVQIGQVVLLTDVSAHTFLTCMDKAQTTTSNLESSFITHVFTESQLSTLNFASNIKEITGYFEDLNEWRENNKDFFNTCLSVPTTFGPSRQYPIPDFQDFESFKARYVNIPWIYYKELFEIPTTLQRFQSTNVIVKAVVKDITIENNLKRKRSQEDESKMKKSSDASSTRSEENSYEDEIDTAYTILSLETEVSFNSIQYKLEYDINLTTCKGSKWR